MSVSGGKKVSDCTVLSEGRPGLSNHRVGEGANPVVQPIHSRQFLIGLPGWYIPSSIPGHSGQPMGILRGCSP